MVKSTGCSHRGPRFGSQHLLNATGTKHTYGVQTYIQSKHPHTCNKIHPKKFNLMGIKMKIFGLSGRIPGFRVNLSIHQAFIAIFLNCKFLHMVSPLYIHLLFCAHMRMWSQRITAGVRSLLPPCGPLDPFLIVRLNSKRLLPTGPSQCPPHLLSNKVYL